MPSFPDLPKTSADQPAEQSSLTGIGTGWAMAIDFVSTIVAAWLIGFGIDWWQKTRPWGSLIGLGFGFTYAIIRILRRSQQGERRSRK
jgi:F0F1-type ATP synthase assembly protein I